MATKLLARGFPAVRGVVASFRGSRAFSASMNRFWGVPLRFHSWRASWGFNLLGGRCSSLAALSRMSDDALRAADMAYDATMATFPVTRLQRFVDSGLQTSQMVRQSREMLTSLRALPDVPGAVLDDVTKRVRLGRAATIAPNIGVLADMTQAGLEQPVRLPGDAGDWAQGAVHQALALRDRAEPPAVRHLYAQSYAALVEQLRGRADPPGSELGAAWALVAEGDLLPVTVVEAALHLLDEGQSLDAFVAQLVVAPQARFAAPDVIELHTSAGPAVRVQQLRVVDEPGPAEEQSVQTSVVHVEPEPGTALTLSAWSDSPVEAELSRAALDELAASLRPGKS